MRTGLVGGAPERVPIRQRRPDHLARSLRFGPDLAEVDAGNDAALHADLAVDDDGIDIVADAAIDHAPDRITHRAVAQRIAAGKIDDDDVGERAGREPPEIITADRFRTAQGRGLEYLAA